MGSPDCDPINQFKLNGSKSSNMDPFAFLTHLRFKILD